MSLEKTKDEDYLVTGSELLKEFRKKWPAGKDAFIGLGGAGCVLRPALSRSGAPESDSTVGKLFRYVEYFDIEMKNNYEVHKMDPDHLFTVRMVGRPCVQKKCNLTYSDNDKCSKITGQNDDQTLGDYLQITYEHGGDDLMSKLDDGSLKKGFYRIRYMDGCTERIRGTLYHGEQKDCAQ